jgi:hypothetical protein
VKKPIISRGNIFILKNLFAFPLKVTVESEIFHYEKSERRTMKLWEKSSHPKKTSHLQAKI